MTIDTIVNLALESNEIKFNKLKIIIADTRGITVNELENGVSSSQYRANMKKLSGKGKLTDQLLSQGLLTPKMLSALQKEWIDSDSTSSSGPTRRLGRPRKKR